MDIIHALVLFEDAFTFAKTKKITTVSQTTFEQMKKGIGSKVKQFDNVAQISYTWIVKEVRQALPSDYPA